MNNITLNDIKRLTPKTEVFIFSVVGLNSNDVLSVYKGQFKDAPLNILNLSVNGIYPISADILYIFVGGLCLDGLIIKEGIIQNVENINVE